MPQYKIKQGKLVRRNAKNEKEVFASGDIVDMTVSQAKTFGLSSLDRQHEDEQEESKKGPELTVNPDPDGAKAPAKKPSQKQAQKPAEKKV